MVRPSPELLRERGLSRALAASLVIFAVAAPWSIAAAQSAIVLTALLLLVQRIAVRPRVPAVPLTLALFGTYLAVQALSIPLGIHADRSFEAYRGSWVLLFPFVFWPALQGTRARRRAVIALVASAALAGLYGIVQHIQGTDWLHGGRTLQQFAGGGFIAVGNLSSHPTYSGVLLPVFFVAIGLAIDARGALRALAVTAACAIGFGIFFSFARTAWLGAAAGLLWLGFGRGWRFGLALAAPAAIVVTFGALLEPAIAARLASLGDITELPRWRLWQTALHIIADHPVLGAGLGSFPTLFPEYKVPGAYLSTIHPHSDVLNAMVETGIAGGIAWLGIWVAFLRETRATSRVQAAPWSVCAARAGVVALLVGGLGQCFSTDEEVAQVWFFVLTATLVEAGVDTTGNRAPLKRLERWLKAVSLPIARQLFSRRHDKSREGFAEGVGAGGAGGSFSAPPPSANRETRILVVRPDDRLGNLILMTPFLARLRATHPAAHVGMLVSDVYAPLLGAWPWIDRWVVQPKRAQIRAPWRFVSWVRDMRRVRWDVAYEMSNHNTHSYYSCLLALVSGSPERVGFDEPRNQGSLTRAVPPPPATRHLSLAPLALLGASAVSSDIETIACPLPADIAPVDLAGGEPYVVVHVGGRGGKALPAATWRAIITRAAAEGSAGKPVVLVVIAGPGERDRVPALTGVPAGRVVMAPEMGVLELASLIRSSVGYVGCDTGVMHLATALGTPTVALFFRSNPYHYAPLGEAHTTILLANPHAVQRTGWEAGDMGVARSRLVILPLDPDASQRGDPCTGDAAITAVQDAIHACVRARAQALTS